MSGEQVLCAADVAAFSLAAIAEEAAGGGLCMGDVLCMVLWRALGVRAVATAQHVLEAVGCPIMQYAQPGSHAPGGSGTSFAAMQPVDPACMLAALQRVRAQDGNDDSVRCDAAALVEVIHRAAAPDAADAAATATSTAVAAMDADGLPLATAACRTLFHALMGTSALSALLVDPMPPSAGASAAAACPSGVMSAEALAAMDVEERRAWAQRFRCGHVACGMRQVAVHTGWRPGSAWPQCNAMALPRSRCP